MLTRISQATGLSTDEVSAWLSRDENYDLSWLDEQLSAALDESDEPLELLVERGVITPEERDDLAG
ncbi:hypothetical protein DGo_CA0098 [Deinococcus gobiensis I-0]|uniref:Uncharacterized protein n=1 Tax=Deinococcus gobiensis (strain DSM 21396 / JCM 16679 / CGMCC 1.7299 / I-0) TaxID=745776 RepID=H8GSR9_DEIGI|nr:hypothetical protein DGo_CA0098 [Deinococcus gobiensis I-0]